MRYTILFSILLLFLFAGCKKNKFSTTPSLKFESVNTTRLHIHEAIRFTLSFTDAEGDLTDSIFFQEVVPGCPADNSHSGSYLLPPFPTSKDIQGDIIVTLGYNTSFTDISPQCPPNNDTATFRFALKDKAQHESDTVSSPVIIIYN